VPLRFYIILVKLSLNVNRRYIDVDDLCWACFVVSDVYPQNYNCKYDKCLLKYIFSSLLFTAQGFSYVDSEQILKV
jgi:hypothetical protein